MFHSKNTLELLEDENHCCPSHKASDGRMGKEINQYPKPTNVLSQNQHQTNHTKKSRMKIIEMHLSNSTVLYFCFYVRNKTPTPDKKCKYLNVIIVICDISKRLKVTFIIICVSIRYWTLNI